MKLKTKIALKLAKELKLDLSSVQLDDITLEYMEEGNLREGYEVFVTDEEGAFILPEDGEYAYGEKTVVIESGIVPSINETEKEKLKKKRKKEKKILTPYNYRQHRSKQ
ncbi:MAG: hypothetical protein LUF04_04305 [Bacteroides sp.]|nr:hypothetical protein [Bacteroides sp.]